MFSMGGGKPYGAILRGVHREDTIYRGFLLSSVAAAVLVVVEIARRITMKQKQS